MRNQKAGLVPYIQVKDLIESKYKAPTMDELNTIRSEIVDILRDLQVANEVFNDALDGLISDRPRTLEGEKAYVLLENIVGKTLRESVKYLTHRTDELVEYHLSPKPETHSKP